MNEITIDLDFLIDSLTDDQLDALNDKLDFRRQCKEAQAAENDRLNSICPHCNCRLNSKSRREQECQRCGNRI